jgi:carboxyl-terminal processing protease
VDHLGLGWLILLGGCLALCCGEPCLPARGAQGQFEALALGRRIVELVREHFYDPQRADAWAAAHIDYATRAESPTAFAALTNEALAQLSSHMGFFTPFDPEYYGLLAIFRESLGGDVVEYESIGADFTRDNFVRGIFAGGPASQAGLRRGDKVLRADGEEFHPVLSFRGRSGRPVVLTVERRAGYPTLEVPVIPRKIDPKREWLDAQRVGSRLIRWHGKVIAYVPLFSCAGEEFQAALHDAIADEFQDAHALILDFRDGWGGCNPDFLNLFNPVAPVLTQIGRDDKERRLDLQWRKPLYILINGGTRSGKEIVAFAVQKHNLGTLIGQRTAGAVVGGRCYLLPDKSLLYLAVTDIRIDGHRLEGQGVIPDVEVLDTLPFADGSDPQLEKALEMAAN